MKKILALALGAALAASAGKSRAVSGAAFELNGASGKGFDSSANAYETLVFSRGNPASVWKLSQRKTPVMRAA